MLHRVPLDGADLRFDADAFADVDVQALRDEVPWDIHRIRMFGRWVDSPRLSCWMGDSGARYRYSGADFIPHAWTPMVSVLRDAVSTICDAPFNSVLINLYRDGRDHMGWHRDNESELGARPTIASLSFGATRRFLLRPRPSAARPAAAPSTQVKPLGIELPHGSLLVMAGDTQVNYQHALARTVKPVGPRINLTFRVIRNP